MSDPQPEGALGEETSRERVELTEARGDLLMSPGARWRLLAAGAVLVGLVGATYVIPSLSRFQPIAAGDDYVPFWNVFGRYRQADSEAAARQQAELSELERLASEDEAGEKVRTQLAAEPAGSAATQVSVYPPYETHADEKLPAKTRIAGVDDLDHYFRRLTLAEMGVPGVLARAGHWGDSVIGDDGVTHAIRKRLQRRFGDGGHGFHVLGRYNLAYRHLGIRYRDRGGWRNCQIIFKCQTDARYGYGGVSTQSAGGGTSVFSTAKEGLGSRVSRFEFWYAEQPDGGKFQIKVDGEVARVIDTQAERLADGVAEIVVPDGEHQFEVRAIGDGMAKGYGVTLEREGPGAVWDGLALIGAFTQRLDYQEAAHIESQMRLRQIDLMVFMLGGNDVQRQKMDLYRSMQPYEEEYAAVIAKYRKGRPEASCLIMSLVDHGERVGRYGIRTRKIVPRLVESQRKVAAALNCAFFNTFEAMGGEGSVARWYHANPRLMGADFGHPTSAGHKVIATLFYQSLMQSYGDFRRRQSGNPFPELAQARTAPKGDAVEAAAPADTSASPSERREAD